MSLQKSQSGGRLFAIVLIKSVLPPPHHTLVEDYRNKIEPFLPSGCYSPKKN